MAWSEARKPAGAWDWPSGSWRDSVGSAYENALRRVGMKTCAREKPEGFTDLIYRRLMLLIRPASFRAQQRFPLPHRPLSTLCYSCLPSSSSPTLDLKTEVALGYTSPLYSMGTPQSTTSKNLLVVLPAHSPHSPQRVLISELPMPGHSYLPGHKGHH